MSILTPRFRVSYPNVFKARRNDLNGKEEFSVVALFAPEVQMPPEDKAALLKLKKSVEQLIISKCGPDRAKWPKGIRSPFRDQAEREKDGKLPEGHTAGAIFLNLKSQDRPGIVDQNKQEIIEPSRFYAGCYARAMVNPYWYDNKGNKGVSLGLQHLQFLADGESLSGRIKVEDAFEAVSDGAQSATDLF